MRVDIKKVLRDPKLRREMMVQGIIAMQAREGIETTREQAEKAYDEVQLSKKDEQLSALAGLLLDKEVSICPDCGCLVALGCKRDDGRCCRCGSEYDRVMDE